MKRIVTILIVVGCWLLTSTAYAVYVDISSKPSGAQVSIDGKVEAKTPCLLELTEGRHEAVLEKSGYETHRETIRVSGEVVDVSFTLEKARTEFPLTIHATPADATVKILNIPEKYRDGIELKNGSYTVQVSKPGYENWRGEVRVDGKPVRQSVVLKKPIPKYSLTISVVPGDARVSFLDGGKVYSPGMQLPDGIYQIEVNKAGYVTWRDDVTIAGAVVSRTVALNNAPYTDPTTGMEFVFIKGGCFMMGSNVGQNDAKPVHEVCVEDFWLGKYEVTQGEWLKIMGSNPSSLNGQSLPVEMVSWNDTRDYIRKLSSKNGKYFRLPTESEWEYAARSGGLQETYAGGNDVDAVAWYDRNSGNTTHPVGQKQPNGLGLYDMSGNVWEWCSDWYDNGYYGKSPKQNPRGPFGGSSRVFRGGSWQDLSDFVRTSPRFASSPVFRVDYLGFRLALPVR